MTRDRTGEVEINSLKYRLWYSLAVYATLPDDQNLVTTEQPPDAHLIDKHTQTDLSCPRLPV
jgi:hypothetical protein